MNPSIWTNYGIFPVHPGVNKSVAGVYGNVIFYVSKFWTETAKKNESSLRSRSTPYLVNNTLALFFLFLLVW